MLHRAGKPGSKASRAAAVAFRADAAAITAAAAVASILFALADASIAFTDSPSQWRVAAADVAVGYSITVCRNEPLPFYSLHSADEVILLP